MWESHEKASRANEGKPQFPLYIKLRTAIPLVGMCITLYALSFRYTKKKMQHRASLEDNNNQPNQILTDVRDIYVPDDKYKELDPEELFVDDNKKW